VIIKKKLILFVTVCGFQRRFSQSEVQNIIHNTSLLSSWYSVVSKYKKKNPLFRKLAYLSLSTFLVV